MPLRAPDCVGCGFLQPLHHQMHEPRVELVHGSEALLSEALTDLNCRPHTPQHPVCSSSGVSCLPLHSHLAIFAVAVAAALTAALIAALNAAELLSPDATSRGAAPDVSAPPVRMTAAR